MKAISHKWEWRDNSFIPITKKCFNTVEYTYSHRVPQDIVYVPLGTYAVPLGTYDIGA